ncbi:MULTISPECIES: hypothetical protein [unclassified Bradyrhizobium]|uniref:hypothetical protein n=1 Tax=unclassified Bradyrhizobium TaxID=2631580 RepID=UPI001FF83E21|nr:MULTISPECIES: hypothetical protein [unclassified Bradyrhizobium]MCK1309884.1 hypothetical protein [Bradyrhizobium sp. 45]MCK1332902.1 hypothetical protein [Bradyrhizobium sp. CW9]MCK1575957.1 hypothetical protein [Bradyrhizobium sp. 174]MCK1633537.1 hypothetical protein [Bradyrhizobium sp. 162]UPJ31763.1 hypothetical protein IVB54_39190 [Bradyrhizobium sp. CW1]
MTDLPRLESQYDAFLFASICDTDEMTLSVLSVLARHDVDPWRRRRIIGRERAVDLLYIISNALGLSDQFRMLSWRIGPPREGTPAERRSERRPSFV